MSVTISNGSVPDASFMTGKFATTYKSITLECDPPVELGSTADESVSFWFVVPAISFPGGLTFTVTDPNGNTFTKSSSTPRTITRSRRTPFNPIKVSFSVSVSDVTITPVSSSLQVGESVSLSATVNPQNATDKTVTWSSSNASVATVSSSGLVTAKAVGTATITASAGGKSATCNVTVTPVLVNSITLNQSSANVNVGGTVSLTAAVTPSNAADKTVTWSSSDAAVATVSNSGVVTGVKAGTATITATAHDGSGVKATCAVT
ncbi:MAG: Ig domain-containing protein, partial [Bacteroidales bacterium]|nr:Ig domain-containing protein [Bacteroidales bacterium]